MCTDRVLTSYCNVQSSKPQSFDFEGWWNDFVATGKLRTGSPICALKPLYEKMREWGFSFMSVGSDDSKIYIGQKRASCPPTGFMAFRYEGINDFPRALHDAFKWMYENRANKVKCKDCGVDLPSPEATYIIADSPLYGSVDPYKTYCEKCYRKRTVKAKCDKDGPCDESEKHYLRAYDPSKEFHYCPFCGEKRGGK
jgi:hypothetical protein